MSDNEQKPGDLTPEPESIEPAQPEDKTPEADDSESLDPFISPNLLLGLSLVGFAVALIVAFTQPTFGVIGYGGLAFGVLALLAWVLLTPRSARQALTGRTARFGGASLLVTVLLIVALTVVYIVVRDQNVRVDLTETDTYSLTGESEQAITAYGQDPTLPDVKILAFYSQAQAGSRDRDTALFDDYVANSNGKISYEFIDPDRNPQQASLYNIDRPGQVAVVSLSDTGEPDVENAKVISYAIQEDLTNAILAAAAQGTFVADFVTVRDGASDQMTLMKDTLTNRFDWTVNDTTLVGMTGPDSTTPLNDPNADGQVLILPGGSAALSQQELDVLSQYLDNGGDLILFAGTNLNDTRTSLATDPGLNALLREKFGLEVNSDVVVDFTQAFQSPLLPVATNLDTTAYVTSAGVTRGQGALVFETPNSIAVSDAVPANVTTTVLAQSSDSAYSISDLGRVLDGSQDEIANNVAQRPDDVVGPFVLAAQAENSATGAKVVIFTSTSIGTDPYAALNVDNAQVAINSTVWTTGFYDYVREVTVPQSQRPQDQPVTADQQQLRNITFLTVLVIPFTILLIGIYVWWSNRRRGQAKA